MRSVAIAAALLVGVGFSAHAAQILAGGSLFAGPAQFRAVCYIYNAGTAPVSLAGTQITSQFGTVQTLIVNECGPSLAAGRGCGLAANVANNLPYNCKTSVDPSKANVRGVLEMRNSSQVTLQNVELR